MIMPARPRGGRGSDISRLFPRNEGRTETLGINLPASIAQAIRRTGNRRGSISEQLVGLMDPKKLQALLDADAELQAKFDQN